VFALNKGKAAAKEAIEAEVTKKANNIQSSILKDVKEGFKKISEENKKGR